MFANWYAELHLFSLATFPPVSAHSLVGSDGFLFKSIVPTVWRGTSAIYTWIVGAYLARRNHGTATIPQYRFNKTKQHTCRCRNHSCSVSEWFRHAELKGEMYFYQIFFWSLSFLHVSNTTFGDLHFRPKVCLVPSTKKLHNKSNSNLCLVFANFVFAKRRNTPWKVEIFLSWGTIGLQSQSIHLWLIF